MEIKVVRQIMEWNENCHNEIQELLNEKGIFMINVMGSPGGGKTTFITKLIEKLRSEYKVAVIEGDIAGKLDAEKIASMNIPVVQLNTEGACHIEAMSIKKILPEFNLNDLDILIVENIGNLVCPAEFQIGEHLKIALLSIPEGDDKVEKYPLMFANANALIISKYDLKEYFNFNEERIKEKGKGANPNIQIFSVNSITGDGVDEFVNWLQSKMKNR
ncbi:hydrogenase nickel incorporation protein HypB [Clostridium tetanomorphum]|uniref:hydrogenase nickel incorporation protein HypB n=1 Tax=Clostridium tetanomorphum TaxID=1553 RepID=UPI00044F2FE0|nr:hydrogenase nickel incorporation protein HypB [Clostridium tetanomorphum]KAJ53363.1 hydrogenase nickel incorporation protein HypB [Clostridium tetanomorphum DSM 665]MBP1863981.1 hydrogenase nickel incorporation protein HypB [Clostridium tetanomorphum]NRS85059.1 hydrogenase nickel incorporation protein HypB [Clostridium tetanomorphum]SQB91411.1 hydrogenase accessory protein HypB [Clostridium tetanomorphum]